MKNGTFGCRVGLLFAFLGSAVFSFSSSQARIVRLSQVEGTVQVDRNTGQGFEKAFPNLPIMQGTKIRTDKDGRAEIEFEDGSALRLAPSSLVEFPELSLRDSGGKVSAVTLTEGTAYVDFKAAKDDELSLAFGHEKLVLAKAAHLRVQMGDANATLAVFKGKVEVEGPSGSLTVDKKQTASFDLSNNDKSTLAGNLEADPFDAWDKRQNQYHQQYSSANSYSPYGYGMSDLNYYGNFFDVPGYGLMWQPYLTGLGWNPFMDGAWFAYPGFGYTWVSAYPWGWMPYRYGTWNFVGGRGWLWQPGTSWSTWNTLPAFHNAPNQFVAPKPPATGTQTLTVGRGPLGTGWPASSTQTVLHNNTAGLGIARGSIRDFGRVSEVVRADGVATTTIHSAPLRTWVPGPGVGMSSHDSERGVGYAGPSSPAIGSPASRSGGAPHK